MEGRDEGVRVGECGAHREGKVALHTMWLYAIRKVMCDVGTGERQSWGAIGGKGRRW